MAWCAAFVSPVSAMHHDMEGGGGHWKVCRDTCRDMGKLPPRDGGGGAWAMLCHGAATWAMSCHGAAGWHGARHLCHLCRLCTMTWKGGGGHWKVCRDTCRDMGKLQSYVYADVMFLISHNVPNALRCNTLFCHTCPPMREASRIE